MASDDKIIVRCLDHVPRRTDEPYEAFVRPLGDGFAVLCGRKTCRKHGVVMMKRSAVSAWKAGKRMFFPNTNTLRILVGDAIFPLE